MRLFIAINFDEKTKSAIGMVRDNLRANSFSGNFTRDENLHLTLVFIGEVDESLVPAIRHAMNSIQAQPFFLKFTATGSFKRENGEIWWLGAENNPMLSELQSTLSKLLAESGFDIEKRKYTPHLTIGRKVKLKNKSDKAINPIEFFVNSFSLMKSENISGTTTYTELLKKALV